MMPRPRPPHLQRERNRHGTVVWFVRLGKGPRIRIRGVYGTPEFDAAYQAAINGDLPVRTGKAVKGSLRWLWMLYRQTRSWSDLSRATRRQRENIMRGVLETGGDEPLSAITGKAIMAGIDRRKAHQARHFLDTMRGMFKWAREAEHVSADPTAGKMVSKPKSAGFPVWDSDDIERFQKRWPTGTRERVALDVLYYTGLRRGDAVVFGRQHIKGGVARLVTEKTGEKVFIPIEPELEATLAAGPCGDLSFIATIDGRPFKKEAFGNWFSEVCRAAGIKKSAHGLRKAGATRDVNRGWTEAELEAKYGWRGGRMASLYTRSMNRERLAIQASERTTTRTSMPAPNGKVRARNEKG
jgi:integrase